MSSSNSKNPTNPINVIGESASGKEFPRNSQLATRNSEVRIFPPASPHTPHEDNSPCAMPFDGPISKGRSAPCDFVSSSHASRLAPNGSIKATFFILGWLAERLPRLVCEIQARGHEVASHGYDHELCTEQSIVSLEEDLRRSKKLLEDITGMPVYGYRAPSFSVNDQVLDLIRDAGYVYDSSFNSFGLNKRYGRIDLNGNGRSGIAHKISESFYEIPISNISLGGKVLPWGGGGYFRIFPWGLFRIGVQSILKKQGAYLFYMHPWEVDPCQPKVDNIRGSFKFRHYMNLDKTYLRLSNMLNFLKKDSFLTCFQYITEQTKKTQTTK